MEQSPKARLTSSASHAPEVDFAIVLARVIEAVKQDPAELRNAIYDLARVKLHQQGWHGTHPIDILDMRRLEAALETAIERVEAISSKQDQLQALKSLNRLIGDLNAGGESSEKAPTYPLIELTSKEEDSRSRALLTDFTDRATTTWSRFTASSLSLLRRGMIPAVGMTVATVLALVLAIVLARLDVVGSRLIAVNGGAPGAAVDHTNLFKSGAIREVGITPAPLSDSKPTPDFPLPTVYGIYALSGGKLYELQPLPGRVPDQRVFMSAMITTPSRTAVPDGRISFLAYRRDFASAAPSRVSVRVIAKVTRAMSVNAAGKPETKPVEDSWAIRSVDFDLRVSPVSGHPEILLLRAESAEFELSPGRYGLVLNGVAYDFTIAGDVTNTVHCLERTVAANGTFYSECRSL